ncbi:MAG: transglycosylase SLT domain-containing protein [Thiovulaceae bacterium]|nr:transglycosylase SLT domain-containing protein [Sulfurimonadaceae bacterium]
MFKYLVLLLLPYVLFGGPNTSSEKYKDIDLLKTFDIDPSFLNDSQLRKMQSSEFIKYKNNRLFQDMGDASAFIPNVREVLNEYKVPPEFLFVAIAESNFSAKANSARNAGGVWQFMPQTAKRYHLRIDKYVDERRDLVKSSRAAAKYLSILHNQFGKWYLAAIAYNCGSGYLSRAIQKAGTDNLHVLLDEKKKYIPAESRRYIRKILALAMVENNEGRLLGDENDDSNNGLDTPSLTAVQVGSGESLSKVSDMLGLPENDLKKFNRQINYDLTPPDANGYDIYIPSAKLSEFNDKYNGDNEKKKYIVYTPKQEDSSSSNSGKYKIQSKIVKDLNKLNTMKLLSKQDIIIPVASKSNIILDKGAYIVKDTDTLESIAKANKVTVAYIKSKNNIKNDSVKAGDRLYINE